ncbi:MAG: hypothetical protein Q8Q09_06015 [Deltaproteobacteria bacterium]|nr:hypothetical protein [Deltaproteobacteria bacterium]
MSNTTPTTRPSFQSGAYLALWWNRNTPNGRLICATGGGHFVRKLQTVLVEAGYNDKLSSLRPDIVLERSGVARELGLNGDATRRSLSVDGAWGPNTQFALYWAAKANGAMAEVMSSLRNDFARRALSPNSMRYAAIIAYHPTARWDDVEISLLTVPPAFGQRIAAPSYDAALRCWDPQAGGPPPDPRGTSVPSSTPRTTAVVTRSFADSNATGALGIVERHPVATAAAVSAAMGLGIFALTRKPKRARRKARR